MSHREDGGLVLRGRDIALIVVLIIVVAVPIYVVGSMAFQSGRMQLATAERHIATVSATVSAPTSYIGVKLAFAYYYKKDENRVRVVITLPEGYPTSAIDTSDWIEFEAHHVLPTWACHVNPLATATYSSFEVATSASLGEDATAGILLDGTYLDNNPAQSGTWAGYVNGDTLSDHLVILGSGLCDQNRNADTAKCLPDFVATMQFQLMQPVDRAAWAAQYDIAR